ncbi:tubulin-specific chaperone A [Apis cerana]|uniref:Tubulin-specific chaperone A n=3 Tax=Apis TaxID=7459 RepID=A0A7M7LMM3_APIME|nr:tubulin-specific chaperone A isoform X2 [Apis mellifera]XP_016913007.1 tubulin-specific chaperone A [Apis cerana]KAG6801712.1 tubulin-specific chaperone A isoform X2 [Apis mellifera caucasica]KAG9436842.1 tubulin-specific chaperone A isoform X2 [Apis mellifera carnica]PBC33776.1 Tubulin-specific chaperone A [Apis cerana cerana]|eukprot:XP_006561337.1 tubulin-specific chaperone A isoform X2 [Apis mellifera]
MSDPRIRILKIKTGVVKRLAKEKVTYEKEAAQQRERIQKLKEQDKDGYDIKKQEEVLQESLMMVPDCQRRLAKAFEELKKILDTEQDLKEIEDYIEAEKILQEAEAQLPKEGEIMEMC